ncbi:BhlA/UviB family holin-like peptide [Clostridium tepidiprofundi]
MDQTYLEIIIAKLTDKLDIVEDVKKDVEDIKNYVFNQRP